MIKKDVERLIPIPNNSSKLSNVVNTEIVEKHVYGKFVTKVNNTDTTELVLKTNYDTDKLDLEKKKKVMSTKRFLILVNLLKNRLCY